MHTFHRHIFSYLKQVSKGYRFQHILNNCTKICSFNSNSTFTMCVCYFNICKIPKIKKNTCAIILTMNKKSLNDFEFTTV